MTNLPVYEKIVTASPAECDFQMKWKPSMFFRRATEAATIHAGELGLGARRLQEQGLVWVLSRMKFKMLQYPAMNDQVTVRTWPKKYQQKLFYIRDFEFVNKSGEPVAFATSAWLVINISDRRLVSPAKAGFELPIAENKNGLDETLDKILCPDSEEKVFEIKAGYSSLDFVGHVNNTYYIDWICDAFEMDYHSRGAIDWIQINFDHEVIPGQTVGVSRSLSLEDPGLWYVIGKIKGTDQVSFTSAVHWADYAS